MVKKHMFTGHGSVGSSGSGSSETLMPWKKRYREKRSASHNANEETKAKNGEAAEQPEEKKSKPSELKAWTDSGNGGSEDEATTQGETRPKIALILDGNWEENLKI